MTAVYAALSISIALSIMLLCERILFIFIAIVLSYVQPRVIIISLRNIFVVALRDGDLLDIWQDHYVTILVVAPGPIPYVVIY